jgi:hypothetical protein
VVLDPPPTKRFEAGPNTYLEPLFEMKSFGYEENDDAVISFDSVEYCPYNDDFWIKTEAEWARKQKEDKEEKKQEAREKAEEEEDSKPAAAKKLKAEQNGA